MSSVWKKSNNGGGLKFFFVAAIIALRPEPTAALTCDEEITRRTGLCVQQQGLNNAASCRSKATVEVGQNCNTQSTPGTAAKSNEVLHVNPRSSSSVVQSLTSKPPEYLLADIKPSEIGRLFDSSRGLIEHFLNWSFKSNQNAVVPISTRIQRALNEATELRGQPGQSLNRQLRNAEYYLHGLYASVSGDESHLIYTYSAAIYDEMKAAVQGSKLEDLKFMRVDKDNPNSPAGGAAWAYMGLQDGKKIRDVESAGRQGGSGLSLPSLHP